MNNKYLETVFLNSQLHHSVTEIDYYLTYAILCNLWRILIFHQPTNEKRLKAQYPPPISHRRFLTLNGLCAPASASASPVPTHPHTIQHLLIPIAPLAKPLHLIPFRRQVHRWIALRRPGVPKDEIIDLNFRQWTQQNNREQPQLRRQVR